MKRCRGGDEERLLSLGSLQPVILGLDYLWWGRIRKMT